jgi:tetratricopeptide (TPR) repeat protein
VVFSFEGFSCLVGGLEVAYYCRSIVRLDSGDIYAALRDVDTAALLSPKDPGPYMIRGEIKVLLYNYDKAVEDFCISIRLQPDNPRAFYGRGVAYFHMEKYDEAVSDLTRAIQLKPEYGKAYMVRGDAKRLLRKWNFCEDYRRAAQLHVPDAEEALLRNCQ